MGAWSGHLFVALVFLTSDSVPAKPKKDSVWNASHLWKSQSSLFTEKGSRKFESEGPMLRSIRVSKWTLASEETCGSAIAKVKKAAIGKVYSSEDPERFAGWGEWTDDLDAVEKCASFPCKIKFNEAETRAIAAKPKGERVAEALKQVDSRVKHYAKTFERAGYDLPEDPIDPWKIFVARGHVMPESLAKAKPTFYARKLPFGDGNYRALRQIFDVRSFETKERFVRIARDVYTSHYFDGWGEWVEVRCNPAKKEVLLLQDLLIEFDLLKKKDLLSTIARPKMRQGVDEESLEYQNSRAELFRK